MFYRALIRKNSKAPRPIVASIAHSRIMAECAYIFPGHSLIISPNKWKCVPLRALNQSTQHKNKNKIADLHRKRVTNQSKWKWDFRFDATCSQPANDDAIWQENAMWLCGPIILVSAWHLMFGDSRPPKKCDMLSTSNRRKHTQRLAIS